MLQYQVSNQLSTLTLKDNETYPLYVSTRDLKIGLSTFWKSPYNETNTRKRELPIVTPSNTWTEDRVDIHPKTQSSTDQVKGILKNNALIDSDESYLGLCRKRLRLRRTGSFSTNISSQISKRVQFDEISQLDSNTTDKPLGIIESEVRSTSQCSRISATVTCPEQDSVGSRLTTMPISSKTVTNPNFMRNTKQSHSLSTMDVLDCSSVTNKQISSSVSPNTTRIPRFCRPQTVLDVSDSIAVEHVSNFTKARPQQTSTSNVVSRPKTCFGNRSAILPNHTNFCNREQTIRILKWLKDVDDKQTTEGRCTELISNLEQQTEDNS